MIDSNSTDRYNLGLQWLSRLMDRLSRWTEEHTERTVERIVETQINEEPMSGQYCSHSRLVRLIAHYTGWWTHDRHRQAIANGHPVCPICGRIPLTKATVMYVLTVWFRDGEVYEYHFRSRCKDDCYRISDSALHIYLADSIMSYSLDLISAVNFGTRVRPPVAPEVLEAERIIAGIGKEE
jgi:hypothetical protein